MNGPLESGSLVRACRESSSAAPASVRPADTHLYHLHSRLITRAHLGEEPYVGARYEREGPQQRNREHCRAREKTLVGLRAGPVMSALVRSLVASAARRLASVLEAPAYAWRPQLALAGAGAAAPPAPADAFAWPSAAPLAGPLRDAAAAIEDPLWLAVPKDKKSHSKSRMRRNVPR